jgi:hypothetical protein
MHARLKLHHSVRPDMSQTCCCENHPDTIKVVALALPTSFLIVTHQDDAVRRPSYECFNGARTSAASCRLEAVYRQLRYCWAMFTEHARTTISEYLSLKHSSMTVSRKHATEPLESHHEQQRYAPCDMAFFSDRNP